MTKNGKTLGGLSIYIGEDEEGLFAELGRAYGGVITCKGGEESLGNLLSKVAKHLEICGMDTTVAVRSRDPMGDQIAELEEWAKVLDKAESLKHQYNEVFELARQKGFKV